MEYSSGHITDQLEEDWVVLADAMSITEHPHDCKCSACIAWWAQMDTANDLYNPLAKRKASIQREEYDI